LRLSRSAPVESSRIERHRDVVRFMVDDLDVAALDSVDYRLTVMGLPMVN